MVYYADEFALGEGSIRDLPRERFVRVGPWRVKSPWSSAEYWTTEDADPRNVYHDVLIALDEGLGLNNGQPSLWAFSFNKLGVPANERVLHLSGTGYYTAKLLHACRLRVISIQKYSSSHLRTATAASEILSYNKDSFQQARSYAVS